MPATLHAPEPTLGAGLALVAMTGLTLSAWPELVASFTAPLAAPLPAAGALALLAVPAALIRAKASAAAAARRRRRDEATVTVELLLKPRGAAAAAKGAKGAFAAEADDAAPSAWSPAFIASSMLPQLPSVPKGLLEAYIPNLPWRSASALERQESEGRPLASPPSCAFATMPSGKLE